MTACERQTGGSLSRATVSRLKEGAPRPAILTPCAGMRFAITKLAESVRYSVGAVPLSTGAEMQTTLKRDH